MNDVQSKLFPQFTELQLASVKTQLDAFWQDSTTHMQPFFKAVSDYERVARVLLPADLQAKFDKRPDRSCLVPPDIFNNLNSISADLMALFFSEKPYATASYLGQPTIRDDRIVALESLLQYLLDVSRFEEDMPVGLDQMLYAGTAAAFLSWHKETKRTAVRAKDGSFVIDPLTQTVVFEDQTVFECPKTTWVDIRRMRIDPSAETMKDVRIIGHHKVVPKGDLIAMNRDPFSSVRFSEKELAMTKFDESKFYEFVVNERAFMPNKGKENVRFGDKLCEIQEVRGTFRFENPNEPDTYEDLIVQQVNRNKLIMCKRNDSPLYGWDHYDFPVTMQVLGRMFGIGLVEPVFDLFLERLFRRNQSSDATNREVYNRTFIDSSAAEDLPESLEYVPDQLIKINVAASGLGSIQQAVMPFESAPKAQRAFEQAQVLGNEIMTAMRRNDYVISGEATRRETATVGDAIMTANRMLLQALAKSIKNTFFRDHYQKYLVLWDHYQGQKELVIKNWEGLEIAILPGFLNFVYQLDFDINGALERPGMVRRVVEMMPMATQNQAVDNYQLWKTVFQMVKMPNANLILPPPQYLQSVPQRENIALMAGIDIPVHEMDNHALHMPIHEEVIMFMKQQGVNPGAALKHYQAHADIQQQMMVGLGNTKETGSASGNLVQPDAAAANIR